MTDLIPTYNQVVIDPATRMDHGLYDFSALPDRPKLVWPNGAAVAMAVVINVDYGDLIATPLNLVGYTYRDYGPRVGVFRLMRILDQMGIKATMPISDVLLERAPAVVEDAMERGWEFVGHGARVNQTITSALTEEDERAYVAASLSAIRDATGLAPRGWFGPNGSQSTRTTAILSELGYEYTLDWGNDDQPFSFHVPKGVLTALPYGPDTADSAVIQAQSHTPWEYERALEDHLETLIGDGQRSGMVMTIGLQAHVSGQPLRAKYVRSFLQKAKASGQVWFATASEIVDAWCAQVQKPI